MLQAGSVWLEAKHTTGEYTEEAEEEEKEEDEESGKEDDEGDEGDEGGDKQGGDDLQDLHGGAFV